MIVRAARSMLDDVGVDVHLDIEPFAEHLGRRDQQRALVGNDVADVVRQSTVREGDIGPAIEDRDLHRLVEAPQSRRTRRAACHPTDNQDTASEATVERMRRGSVSVMAHRISHRKSIISK